MKNSTKILIIKVLVIVSYYVCFIIPVPDGWLKENINFIPLNTTSMSFDTLVEIDAKDGTSLTIFESDINILRVGGINKSDCFVYDRSLNYVNFYCEIGKYAVTYEPKTIIPKLKVKSMIPKLDINKVDIRHLNLYLNQSKCTISEVKYLQKLEITGDNKSEVHLKSCQIDTLIIDQNTKLLPDGKSKLPILIRR